MKRRKKWIVILLAGVLVLSGVAALLLSRKPEPPAAEEVFALPGPGEVRSVSVANESGSYRIVRAGGAFRVDGWEYDLETDEQAAEAFLRELLALTPDRVVTAEPDGEQLADFALAEPRAAVEIETADGGVLTLYLGRKSGISGAYYARLSSGRAVYVLSGGAVGKCLEPVFKLVRIRLYEEITDETLPALTAVRLLADGEPAVELRRKDTAENLYEMVFPFPSELDWSRLHAALLEPLKTLEAESFLEGDPAAYGLAEPAYSLELEYAGTLERVDFSAPGEDGLVYMRREGDERIYTALERLTRFVTRDYLDLLGGSAYVCNINRVETLSLRYGGRDCVFRLRGQGDSLGAALEGGGELGRLPLMEFFGKLTGIPVVGDAGDVPEGPALFEAALTMKDGARDEIRLVPVNERQCAVVLNGTARHLTLTSFGKWLGSEAERVTALAMRDAAP